MHLTKSLARRFARFPSLIENELDEASFVRLLRFHDVLSLYIRDFECIINLPSFSGQLEAGGLLICIEDVG